MIPFLYEPGSSLIHRIDPRIKVLSILAFSTCLFFCGYAGLCMAAGFSVMAFHISRLPVLRFAKRLSAFAVLFAVIVCSRALTVAGEPFFCFAGIRITGTGFISGIVYCVRIVCLILIGELFVGTTSQSGIRAAIVWFLKPFPRKARTRAATLVTLTLSLLPLLFRQMQETDDALKSRCIEKRRNPFKRMLFRAWPPLRDSLIRADELAFALESRCYSELRTERKVRMRVRDCAAFSFVAAWCAAMVLL